MTAGQQVPRKHVGRLRCLRGGHMICLGNERRNEGMCSAIVLGEKYQTGHFTSPWPRIAGVPGVPLTILVLIILF